jgi:metal-responsive CopG/Arc/MetJ family transcriptional regulator
MAEQYSISLPDDLADRLDSETQAYGDNRSAVIQAALRDHWDMETVEQ